MGDVYDATIGELTGSNRAADAAGRAAQAQERAQQRAVGFAQEGLDSAKASGLAAIEAAKSPQELNALTSALGRQEKALARQEQIMAQIDPAVLEASQQALQLLRGEEARALGPLKEQRQRDRQRLVDNLREQMGPGAETSTAGMQALNQFDQQTSQVLSQAQQGAMGQLFGFGMQGVQGRLAQGQLTNQGIGQLGNIGQAFGNYAGRQAQTALGAGQLEQGGFANLINAQQGLAAASGSEFVATQLRGQAQNQFVNDRIQAGEQMASQMMGSLSSGAGAAMKSDIRAKENIRPLANEIDEFLGNLNPYEYTYRDIEDGIGIQHGVMAQDLEKSNMGKRYVFSPEGIHGAKWVDYPKMLPAMLASMARMNKRIQELEEMLNAKTERG